MPRVKRGPRGAQRRNKVLKASKGNVGGRRKLFRHAKEQLARSLMYAYRDRRNRKRDMRSLWIQRLNAAARLSGLSYSQLIHGLKLAGIDLDRKVLSDLAIHDPAAFATLAGKASEALAAEPRAAA